jgi:tRNA(fMet)-specific endonuclease VapC
MAFLLDTNVWVVALRGKNAVLADRILRAPRPQDILLCSVVKAELVYGAMRSGNPQRNLQSLTNVFSNYASLPFNDSAADSYAQVRIDLERQGTPIGPNDMLIAAIALANNLTLVTHNTREFSRIGTLQLEDWQAP